MGRSRSGINLFFYMRETMLIDFNDPQLEDNLRTQEQVYNQVRMTGKEAPARILSQTACSFCGSPLAR